MKRKQYRRAFTLVEMLTVAGILVILSAILLPVFHSAREHGRSTSCISNLKQLGAAFSMYIDDNARRYPPANSETPQYIPGAPLGCPIMVETPVTWRYLILRYTRVDRVFLCPSVRPGGVQFASVPTIKLWDDCPPPVGGPHGGSGGGTVGGGIPCPTPPPIHEPSTAYIYNTMFKHQDAWLNSPGFKPGEGFAIARVRETHCAGDTGPSRAMLTHNITASQSRITNPGGVILLAEADENGYTPRQTVVISDAELDYTQDKPKAPIGDVPANIVASRNHWNGFNALFADNHVKWIQYGTSKPAMWTIEND